MSNSQPSTRILTTEERKLALDWYCNKNYDLITIAQHFDMHAEELKAQLHNVK